MTTSARRARITSYPEDYNTSMVRCPRYCSQCKDCEPLEDWGGGGKMTYMPTIHIQSYMTCQAGTRPRSGIRINRELIPTA